MFDDFFRCVPFAIASESFLCNSDVFVAWRTHECSESFAVRVGKLNHRVFVLKLSE